MTVAQATNLIFKRLCDDFRARGAAVEMTRVSLGEGIPEEVFVDALRGLRGYENDQDLQVEFVGGSPDRIRLGLSWRRECEKAA